MRSITKREAVHEIMNEFPPCDKAGRVTSNQKRFCRATPTSKLMTVETCISCPYASGEMSLVEFQLNYTDEPRDVILTCQHRGPVVERKRCELCGPEKGKQVPVHECRVHGKCTSRRYNHGAHEQVCLTCNDRLPAGASVKKKRVVSQG